MVTRKEVHYQKKWNFLNIIQYIIGILIFALFVVGLIPFNYGVVGSTLLSLLVIQIIISLFRLSLFAVFLELLLLFLAVAAFFPVLGYIPRILGALLALLDLAGFQLTSRSKKVIITNFSKRKKPQYTKDAEFSEK